MGTRFFAFDSVNGDRIISANSYSNYVKNLYFDGYVPFEAQIETGLKVEQQTTPNMTVKVNIGAAFIQGFFFQIFDTAENVTIPAAHATNIRVDMVVVRMDKNTRDITLKVLSGPADGSLTDPTLTRTSLIWDLAIARVTVGAADTTITNDQIDDLRNDRDFCGKAITTAQKQGFVTTKSVDGWFRIARNGTVTLNSGDQTNAHAMFTVRAFRGVSLLASATFYASIHKANFPTLSLVCHSFDSGGSAISMVRLVHASNSGAALEVFVDTAGDDIKLDFDIFDNYQDNGWVPQNWTAGSIPPSFSDVLLDFTANQMIVGVATEVNDSAWYINREGKIHSKGDISLLTNNKALRGAETGGTGRELMKIDGSNEVVIGNVTNVNKALNEIVMATNNKAFRGIQSDGTTRRNLAKVNALNNIEIGDTARPIFLDASSNPQWIDGASVISNIWNDRYVLPQARVFHNANQSIANATTTTLAFNSERWDTNGMHDNVTNNGRLTAQFKGLYQIGFNGEWDSNATGQRQFFIAVNGTPIATLRLDASGASTTQMNLSAQYQLNVGDFVTVSAFQNSGGALNVLVNANFSPEFYMALLSPF